jgi:hypothetical protein
LSQVLWNDVMECTDISAGLDVLGKYGLHDLVQLDAAMGGGAQQHMAVGACNVARCIPFPLTLASAHLGARRLAPLALAGVLPGMIVKLEPNAVSILDTSDRVKVVKQCARLA